MKVNRVVAGFLAGGAMLFVTATPASANVSWCIWDPPLQVVSPGGHNLVVNTQVSMSAGSQSLRDEVVEYAAAQSDARGGTLVTVSVWVPAQSRVVASVFRAGVSAQQSGTGQLTLYLDVPIT